jgi:hypothetical protein
LVKTAPDNLLDGFDQQKATGKLVELYKRIHNVAKPSEVVQFASECDVHFLPPVSAAG